MPPKSQSLAEQLASSALNGANADYIEGLYEIFLRDRNGVEPAWREYFGPRYRCAQRSCAWSDSRTPAGRIANGLGTGGAR
jgi:2-oxoglutarate dehydrogenase complex dehydrogenase (E1) component-like enzyme